MNKFFYLPSLLLLLLNCYLTDLEEYKHLEKHDDDSIDLVGTFSDWHLDFDDDTIHFIEFDFNFSIERSVYFDFFRNKNSAQQLSSVRMAKNEIKFNKGKHHHINQLIYYPQTAEEHFILKIRAISEIDTLERIYAIDRRYIDLDEDN